MVGKRLPWRLRHPSDNAAAWKQEMREQKPNSNTKNHQPASESLITKERPSATLHPNCHKGLSLCGPGQAYCLLDKDGVARRGDGGRPEIRMQRRNVAPDLQQPNKMGCVF
jgi:hypothetical protein